jgi:integrase
MGYGDGTHWYDPKRDRWIGRYERHDGRARRQRGQVSARTEAEVLRKLAAARRTSATLPGHDERLRLDSYLRRWLDEMTPTVRARTADGHRSRIETHIIPRLGGHKLSNLRAVHIADFRDDLLAAGLSPRTVNHNLTTLRYALAKAVEWRMVDRNEGTFVSGPHVPQGDRKPLSTAQARTLMATVKGDPWEAIYLLAVTLGMRQAEILGLRWSDVGLAVQEGGLGRPLRGLPREDAGRGMAVSLPDTGTPGSLEVRKTLTWLHGRATLEDPKTERSHRTLTLPRRVAEAIEQRRLVQRDQRLGNTAWNPHWTEGWDLVFTTANGYAIERTSVTRAFQRHLREVKLPIVPFHSLRHTATGWLLELGLSMREVADILGHSKPSQTSDTYSHLGGTAAPRAAKLLDEVM